MQGDCHCTEYKTLFVGPSFLAVIKGGAEVLIKEVGHFNGLASPILVKT